MYRLKKINISPLANTLALIYFVIGIFLAAIFIIDKEFPVEVTQYFGSSGEIIFTILFPFMYAIGGYLSGIIVAILYNQSVRFTKGISFELVSDNKKK